MLLDLVQAHTSGINWDTLSAQITVISAAITVATWIIVRVIRSLFRETKEDIRTINTKIVAQDTEMAAVKVTAAKTNEAVVSTQLGVARIEGFLAALNGKGSKLPEIADQTEH